MLLMRTVASQKELKGWSPLAQQILQYVASQKELKAIDLAVVGQVPIIG